MLLCWQDWRLWEIHVKLSFCFWHPQNTQHVAEFLVLWGQMRTPSGKLESQEQIQFIQLNNKNHLFLTIVSVEVCAYELRKLWRAWAVWGEKGKKKNNKFKTQQVSSQPIYPFMLVGFCLAFVYLLKTEVGVLYCSPSNISGSSRFEAGGEERKREQVKVNLTSSFVLGNKDAMAGSWWDQLGYGRGQTGKGAPSDAWKEAHRRGNLNLCRTYCGRKFDFVGY